MNYVVTAGRAANTDGLLGTPISASVGGDIQAIASTNLHLGSDQTNPKIYKAVASLLYAAGSRAVTRADYNALAFTYPGVIDARPGPGRLRAQLGGRYERGARDAPDRGADGPVLGCAGDLALAGN